MRAEPLEPEVAAALEAIDATLHGEPADPQFAELAELSLILRADRPEPARGFASRLDREVAAGFSGRAVRRERPRWPGRRIWAASLSSATAIAAAVVLAVVLVHGGHGSSSSSASGSASGAASGAASSTGASSGAASGPGVQVTPKSRQKSPGPAPLPKAGSGRKLAQSARVVLVAQPGAVDRIAKQVFGVVGAEHGYVDNSSVDAHATGTSTARFALEVPSGRLESTLTRLSRLTGARVTSRTDSSQDVTAQIDGDGAALAQAQALRRSLLRQLAAADTSKEVLTDERALRRNRTTIAADETALAKLRRRVSYSAVTVSVSGRAAASADHRARSGGGLSLRRGLHDAGRVLVVAASVALIALAVLAPVGLVAACIAWVWAIVLRRRRESTLSR